MTNTSDLEHEIARLRAELAWKDAVLQSLIDAMPANVYIRDTDGVFHMVNQAQGDLLQMELHDIIGKRDADLFPEHVMEGFRATDRQALDAGVPTKTDDYIVSEDGVRVYQSVKFPIYSNNQELLGIGGLSIDVTEEQERSRVLQSLLDNSPMVIYVKDLDGRYMLINEQGKQAIQLPHEEIIGKTDYDFFPVELAEDISTHDAHVVATDKTMDVEDVILLEGSQYTYRNIKFPLHDAQGMVYGVGAFAFDITDQKQAERERALLHQQIIDAQKQALRELSTPLLPIAPGVIVMPLVGSVDSQRVQMVMEALLGGVLQHQADLAIVDITGVQVVDTQVAKALVQVAKAVHLLGAQMVLTGIQPQIAQTLVHLGSDLAGIHTHATLQSGIATVLKEQ